MLAQINEKEFELNWVTNYNAAQEEILRYQHEVYLINYMLGNHTGLELLRKAVDDGCKVPIVMLTPKGDHKVDIEAMKIGASDYLVKGQVNAVQLERCIRYVIERRHVQEEQQDPP